MKANQKTRVVVDAMGGDYAPEEIVKGAVSAAQGDGLEVLLVGPQDIVEAELAKYDTSGLSIRSIPADDYIREGENPALAARRKPNSSIAVAMRMMKEGEADGLISGGPTGAVVTSAICTIGMIEGIKRPVIGGAIFDAAPKTVVFGCGVNMDCKPYHLLTFAVLGSVYCKKLLGVADPAIGLLNIGAEGSKGNQLTKETYSLLEKSGLNFIGNIEGYELLSGRANVIVCDAFVGNVLFKFVESIGLFEDTAGTDEKRDLGGGLIWGVNGIVRKVHGHSRAAHVASKISHVKLAAEVDLIGAIKSELAAIMKLTKT